MKRSWTTFVLSISVALYGCSSAETDWNKASTANTVAAYQQFLHNHPTGQHSVAAADRIHALQDEQAWTQAKQDNSADEYRGYLQNYPAGVHLKEAQEARTAVERAADWTEAQSKGTVASIQDFLRKYPDGTEADQARAKLSALSGYKVELASAKTRKLAEKERDHLRSKYGNILHDVVVVPANSGKSYRLESAPMSQTEADSACSELKKAHQSCEVIKSETGKG